MSKSLLTALSVIAILLIIFAYFGGIWQNKDKIHRAQLEMERLSNTRDSLQTVVSYRDSLQGIMKNQINTHKNEAETLRKEVQRLEKERENKQLSVRRLRRPDDLKERLLNTFPELAGTDWGVTEVFNEENGIDIEYLLVPLWFSETFIIDHQNAISYKEQKHKLHQVDTLNQEIIVLQDSIGVLEQLNRQAYERGFEVAYIKYDSLNNEYIKELKKGNINWGWQTAGILTGGVVGILIGRGTK
jgi:hypothetical protein